MTRINVLLIGSGGREHALAWKLAKSPMLDVLHAAPGNPGIEQHGRCVGLNIADHQAVIDYCRRMSISLVIIGPEAPLVAGLADDLREAGIKAFGPGKTASRLEASKGFTKDLCRRHGIPTAPYSRVSSIEEANDRLRMHGLPVVIKADGLAAGKGVTVAYTDDHAHEAVHALFAGNNRAEAVIEDYLEGEEASFFALVSGTEALALATAQDHKRVGEGDTGPNTGGMGAYSPAPVLNEVLCQRIMDEIIHPTLRAMEAMGAPYQGVLYAGLMITAEGPKLIEYNVRFGDPECQVLMMRLEDDLLDLILSAADGRLGARPRWKPEAALTVVMAARGYPGDITTGSEITGLDEADAVEGVKIFHAGTARKGQKLVSAGGRVLNVTALGKTVSEAQQRAYRAVQRIHWPDGFCRRDIGYRAVEREKVAVQLARS